VIASQGLTTFAMIGPDLAGLSEKLQGKPGVEQTAAFGGTVHVTGKDGVLLEKTLRDVTQGTGARFAPVETGLEDVFIHLMQRATDNWGNDGEKEQAKQ
jgi:ABC-2 type transport system ATP-binding protein